VDTDELSVKFLFPFVLQSTALQPKNSCTDLKIGTIRLLTRNLITKKKVFFKLMGVISTDFT
jgi:hypothetical protein